MRFTITFLCIIAFATASFGQKTELNGAYLSIEQDTLNYGAIKMNSNGERKLKVTNTGNANLIITSCTGSCGCTVPKCPDYTLLPGKSGKIKIVYDTKRIGAFSKTVTIKSNAINNTVYIKVIGEVKP